MAKNLLQKRLNILEKFEYQNRNREKLKKSSGPPGTGGEAPAVIGNATCSPGTGADEAERTKHPPINKGRLLKKSRMPELPRGDMKIVVRPRSGFRVSEVTKVELSRALAAAAQVTREEERQDVVCPNGHQNIVVISTPRRENADRYAAVERIDVRGTAHEVSTYEAAPHGTVKGVIQGILLEDTAMDIQEQVVQDYNPTALQANRIGRSRSVVIVFAGKPQDMSSTATSLRSAHYIESRLRPVNPAAGWSIEWMCAQTLTTKSVEGAESPSPPKITCVSPSAAFAAAATSQRTERVKRVSRLLSSSGNADGKGSSRYNKNGDEVAIVEVLQADPNEATVRDQGAPTVAGAAAPGRYRGCAVEAAAGGGAPAQS